MSLHNIGFHGETWTIIPTLSSNTHLISFSVSRPVIEMVRLRTGHITLPCSQEKAQTNKQKIPIHLLINMYENGLAVTIWTINQLA